MEEQDHKLLGPLTVESLYPLVIGLVAGAVTIVVYGRLSSDFLPQGENMLASLVTLGGIVAGFLATMKTLLIGMSEETAKLLTESNYVPQLKKYLGEALRASLCLCIVAIAGFAPILSKPDPLYQALLFGFLAYSLAALLRVTLISMALLLRR